MTPAPADAADPAFPSPPRRWPGLLLAATLALLAQGLGHAVPLVGGAVIGLVLGMLVGNLRPPGRTYAPGITFAGKQVLQLSVVLLGFGLNLGEVARTGMHSLAVTLLTLAIAFASAWLLSLLLKVPGKLAVLIGVGTGICGGSAIAAVTPILHPDEHDTAYAISTIFLFNLVAVLLFPPLGHLLHLSDTGFGLWAGTAINDTSSVVAAGYQYSHAAGDHATIVKLTRATLIVPVCLLLVLAQSWRQRRHAGGSGDFRLAQAFPWFILWFIVASALRSTGGLPTSVLPILHQAAGFLIVVALTAIGLSANLRRIVATGPRPILLGLFTWAATATASLLIQVATHQT